MKRPPNVASHAPPEGPVSGFGRPGATDVIALRSMRVALIFALVLASRSCFASADAPRLELDVALDPSTRHLQVSAFVVPDTRVFRFALYESLQVTAASAGGVAVAATVTSHSGGVREWQVRLPPGAQGVRLQYAGTLPALDARLDERAVLHKLAPMASVEGSFLPAGSAWYPQPAPLFSYRVALAVPAGQKAIVPGRLESEEVAGGASGRYRAVFAFSQRAEGIDLMAGPWIVREKIATGANAAPVRLRTYFPRDLDAMPGLAQGYLDDTARYIRGYSTEIGPYPFSEFSIVASPLPTGFGMPTLTYIGQDVLKLPFIRATSLGHEVLHDWWGNGVFVDYAHGNWSEGLTTFMADYAYKERESGDAAREMRQGWLRDFAAVPAGMHETLASFRSRTHGAAAAVGYGKAAMVFVMLRDLIGQDAFRRGVRVFWARYRQRVASWRDLQAAFEEASGRSLATFFDQWLDRAEGPSVTIAAASARREKGNVRLTLTLEQTAPAYALHLPVEIASGARRETVWVDVQSQRTIATVDTACDSRERTARSGSARLACAGTPAVAAYPAQLDRRARAGARAGLAQQRGAKRGRGARETSVRGPAGNDSAGNDRTARRSGIDRRPSRRRGSRARRCRTSPATRGRVGSRQRPGVDAVIRCRCADCRHLRCRCGRTPRARAAAAALRAAELDGVRQQSRRRARDVACDSCRRFR